MKRTKVFLSHISEEAQLAQTIKTQLERAVPGAELFVSTVDVHLGQAWLSAINAAIKQAKAVLVLCSRQSTGRPWVNFESGAGWARGLSVIPVCHGGLRKDDLPYPLSIFQGLELGDVQACEELARRLGQILGLAVVNGFDFEQMARGLDIQPPQRGSEIGIVLTHGQDEWDSGHNSVFDLPKSLGNDLVGHWSFRPLRQVGDLLSTDLHKLSGIILGNPWRKRMAPEVVLALREWVLTGGRLLLLGFELGDRHHDGNLEDLSRHFGIHPAADIVAPAGYSQTKPYGIAVDFQVADGDPHPLTKDLQTIRLANVQTVYVEPGGAAWLRVGKNVVYRPDRTSVEYRRGTLTQPGGEKFDTIKAAWLPVAVEAPSGLCGDGAVQAIGTWQLRDGPMAHYQGDNLILFKRLLDWLAHSASPI